VQVVAFSTVDGANMLTEGIEISLGDLAGDDAMISLEYSGGDDLLMPNFEQNIDETRITRSMSAPRTDAIEMPSLVTALKELGVSGLSQPAELAVRDSVEAYKAQHSALTRALAMEWSGRDPDAAPAADAATPQERIQKAMELGAEEMRRASDAEFVESRFSAWRRAPAAYAQLESALLDGVAQALAIGGDSAQPVESKDAVATLRARRALAVEQGLLAASGRPASLDMGGYAASLDLRALCASTPLSSADRAATKQALAGYEAALQALLAQRREAAVDIERTNQLMGSVALAQYSGVAGADAPAADMSALEAALARARAQTDEAMARGQAVGKRLEEWHTAQSDALLAALTPAGRSRVAAALTRARHPTVASDSTSADPQIARAMSMVESSDALLQAVIAVAGEYQAAYDAIFARLVAADAARQSAVADLAAANAKSPPDEAAVSAARARRSAANREVTRLRTERNELNARTLRALRAALGSPLGQEIADLPPRRPMPGLRAAAPTGPVTPG
jgi:chromosome segregation protein